MDSGIRFDNIPQSYKLPSDTIKKKKINQPESIKWSKLLVKHNKGELYEWGELFLSPVSEAQRRRAGGGGGSHSRVGIRLPTEISRQERGSEKNKQAS